MTYAAYLRICEPVAAFGQPGRSRWAAYAASPARPGRRDCGGLVQLLSDDALSSDQSVAEIAAAIDGVARGERELAVAMYKRAHSRWGAFAGYEMAS
jgi:hypothetical protein